MSESVQRSLARRLLRMFGCAVGRHGNAHATARGYAPLFPISGTYLVLPTVTLRVKIDYEL